MARQSRPRRRTFRAQGTSHTPTSPTSEPDLADPAGQEQPSESGSVPVEPEMYVWRPRQVVKVTTQMTVEHRRLMDHLTRSTGKSMWELLRDAIDHTYPQGEGHTP